MHRSRGLPRTFLMLWAVGGLAVSGFLSGCGTEAPISQKDLRIGDRRSEGRCGGFLEVDAAQSALPKNVNPDASNSGTQRKICRLISSAFG